MKLKYLILLLLFLPVVNAQAVDIGVAPDSFFYGIDVALDKISLALTTGDVEKARKGLLIAQERLLEVRAMLEANKFREAEEAERNHNYFLNGVSNSIAKTKASTTMENYRKVVKIENDFEGHKTQVEFTKDDVKIKFKGGITTSQQDMIDAILANLDSNVKSVKISIDNRKGEIKIKIKQETRMSDDDLEDRVEKIEHEEEDLRKGKVTEEKIKQLLTSVNTWDNIVKNRALKEQEGQVFAIWVAGDTYNIKIENGMLMHCPSCTPTVQIRINPGDVEDIIEAIDERDLKDMTKLSFKYLR